MDWTDLQYVLAVAETGSLAAAARRLDVNHATVLRRIDRFETRHGTRIFDRLPTGYRLLPEQAHLMTGISAVGDQVQSIARMVTGEADGHRGSLTLTTTDSLAPLLAARHVPRFRRTFPDVALSLVVTNLRLDLGRMDADIAIRPTRDLPEGFEGARICDLSLHAYCARSGGESPAPDRQELDWVAPGESLARSPVGEWMGRNVPVEQIVVRADSFPAMADLAVGLGAATMVPRYIGESCADLWRIPWAVDEPVTGLWVVAHRDRARSVRMRTFLEFFQDTLGEDSDVLSGPSSGGGA